ncbi:MAG: hypothetical protein IPN86_13790, partial [Saprospiraceae bacterium]|nr:hypothetical protein [Saprospiraceae bacterium]
MWIHFFKRPIDNLRISHGEVNYYEANQVVRDWYFNAEWYEILDFIEFCVNNDKNKFAN